MSSITTLQLRHTKHSGWYLCSPATWNHKQQKKGLIFKVFARLEAEGSNTPTAKLRSPSGVCCSSEVSVCRRPSSCCDTVVTPASLTLSGICYDVTSFLQVWATWSRWRPRCEPSETSSQPVIRFHSHQQWLTRFPFWNLCYTHSSLLTTSLTLMQDEIMCIMLPFSRQVI